MSSEFSSNTQPAAAGGDLQLAWQEAAASVRQAYASIGYTGAIRDPLAWANYNAMLDQEEAAAKALQRASDAGSSAVSGVQSSPR